jgi:PPK2 family polyphosphate:nucleotide phosphotransferase
MKMDIDRFRIPGGKKVDLGKIPTRIKPMLPSGRDMDQAIKEGKEELIRLQNILYAGGEYALLLVFQAMDAAGKDGAIKHLISGVDPHGFEVHSFKKPSETELKHDFLWRTNLRLPERGKIGIFNRSYYEEVIAVRVHPEHLEAQKLPGPTGSNPFWSGRYRSIVESENHLHRNGTRIVKFFLHVSKEEQRKRLLKRIDKPEKNWKFNIGDIGARKSWGEYMKAYASCLEATSTESAPWYAIPADDKENARLIISRIVLDTLGGMGLKHPVLPKDKLRELEQIRKHLIR